MLNCPVKIDLIGCSNQCFVVPCRCGALTDLWHLTLKETLKKLVLDSDVFQQENMFVAENMFVSLQQSKPETYGA